MTNSTDANHPAPGHCQPSPDADVAVKGSLSAMRRAALKARQVAEQTGTDLIVMRSGAMVRVPPLSKPAAD